MRSDLCVVLALLAISPVSSGCRSGDGPKPEPRGMQAQPSRPADADVAVEAEISGGATLDAAGLSLALPPGWEVHRGDDPNFALAIAPAPESTQVFTCMIELRRQGPGALSPAAKLRRHSTPEDLRYNQGPARGRMRSFPGPSADATVVAHCRGPRSSTDWGPIDAALDALAPADVPALASAAVGPAAQGGDIVELCTGSPVRKTEVCVRHRDGAVLCGLSSGAALSVIEGIPAAAALGCGGIRTCILDAEGHASCWKIDEAPVPVPSVGRARDLAGGCMVSEAGAVVCRERRADGMTLDAFIELLPLGDPKHAIGEATQVLAGSGVDAGCVVAAGELRCWDRADTLALEIEDRATQLLTREVGEVEDLVRLGDRVCTLRAGELSCLAQDSVTTLAGCSEHSCGCTLVASSGISCEHEPYTRVDIPVFGHISGVTHAHGPCAARRDGTLVCRGHAPRTREDSPEVAAMVTGKVSGILHALEH